MKAKITPYFFMIDLIDVGFKSHKKELGVETFGFAPASFHSQNKAWP